MSTHPGKPVFVDNSRNDDLRVTEIFSALAVVVTLALFVDFSATQDFVIFLAGFIFLTVYYFRKYRKSRVVEFYEDHIRVEWLDGDEQNATDFPYSSLKVGPVKTTWGRFARAYSNYTITGCTPPFSGRLYLQLVPGRRTLNRDWLRETDAILTEVTKTKTDAQLKNMVREDELSYYVVPVLGALVFSVFLFFAVTSYGGVALVELEVVVALLGLIFLIGGLFLLRWSKKTRLRAPE